MGDITFCSSTSLNSIRDGSFGITGGASLGLFAGTAAGAGVEETDVALGIENGASDTAWFMMLSALNNTG